MGLVARPFPLEEQTVGKGDEKRAGKMSEVNAKMSIWGDAEQEEGNKESRVQQLRSCEYSLIILSNPNNNEINYWSNN